MTAVEDCPDLSEGKTSRSCDDKLGGWQEPDLFNCTSEAFIEQRHQLAALETNDLTLNTYVAVKIARDVHRAVNVTRELYGADLLIAESLLVALLRYEESLVGLNLTHSQDKDYVSHLVGIASNIMRTKYVEKWARIETLNGDTADKVLDAMANYLKTLTASQHDTFTNPFEVVDSNVGKWVSYYFLFSMVHYFVIGTAIFLTSIN